MKTGGHKYSPNGKVGISVSVHFRSFWGNYFAKRNVFRKIGISPKITFFAKWDVIQTS